MSIETSVNECIDFQQNETITNHLTEKLRGFNHDRLKHWNYIL